MHQPKLSKTVLLCLFTLCITSLKAQDSISKIDKLLSLPDNFFNAIDKKAGSIEGKLTKQTEKYLNKIARQENKLKKKLYKKDSLLAKQLFDGVDEKYNALKSSTSKHSSLYSGHLDSLSTALSFLKSDQLNDPRIDKSLSGLKNLQDKLNATENN